MSHGCNELSLVGCLVLLFSNLNARIVMLMIREERIIPPKTCNNKQVELVKTTDKKQPIACQNNNRNLQVLRNFQKISNFCRIHGQRHSLNQSPGLTFQVPFNSFNASVSISLFLYMYVHVHICRGSCNLVSRVV